MNAEKYLSKIIRPNTIPTDLVDYSLKYLKWKENLQQGNYTFKDKLIFLPGGMAIGASVGNGVMHSLIQKNISFPMFLGSSAPAMSLAMLQLGYFPKLTQKYMTDFNMQYILGNPLKNLVTESSFFDYHKLLQHYLRFAPRAKSIPLNPESIDGKFSGKGFNIGLVVTDFQKKEPHILTQGNLIESVIATGAYPVAFPPANTIIGKVIDGDLSNYLPIHELEYFLNFKPKEIFRVKIKGNSNSFAVKALSTIFDRIIHNKNHRWAKNMKVRNITINLPKRLHITATDFHKINEMNEIFEIASSKISKFFS